MTRAELLALAERVEAAAGPDRDLEAEVWVAVFDPDSRSGGITIEEVWHGGPTREALHTERGSCWADECKPPVGRYMSSIDAAASLMPPRWDFRIDCYWTDENTTSWAVNAQNMDGSKRARGYAKDEPRARLAAALRARAAEAGE